MRLPDFVVIGAAKAGTTSLHALLDRHPDIFMPRVKEPEFFARDDRYAAGVEAYAQGFAEARADQTVGEASTIYSLSPLFGQTAARMNAHLPQAKLIYVMRDPVARAYSYYVQILKNYQNVTGDRAVHRSFEEFVLPEPHSTAAPREKAFSTANAHLPDVPELCLAGSEYVQQIMAYRAHFDADRFLFLKFEDFVTDRAGVLRQVTDFLGLSPLADAVFEEASVTRNVSKAHFNALEETVTLDGMRKRAGPLWALRQAVPTPLREMLRRQAVRRSPAPTAHIPPPMQDETRALLRTRFAAQIPELERLTGLTFAEWDL
ncbi:sulfotransferase [uncultured Roseobacter sp.]|uniref:sulfotransferase n=1 Tax=uncultured Roseobacter sp. TaxID=114847 RepID=UPI0026280D36|nr:sulfotransferase [uncultured Roseobacter sp.]